MWVFFLQARRFHECRRAEGVLAVLELARAQALFARKANAAWKQVRATVFLLFGDVVCPPPPPLLTIFFAPDSSA